MATTRQTRQFLTAVAALILGTYGTQANHFTVDNQGIAADSVLIADDDSVAQEGMFLEWETYPEYPGGNEAMLEYIKSNRQFPQEAMDRGVAGRVIVQFTVDSTGHVCKECVVKSIDPQLDGEAIRLIRNMPRWKPGAFRGRPWNVRYTLPVTFDLPDSATNKVVESPKPKEPTIEEAVEYESKYEDMLIHHESQPEFPGGVKALMEYVEANIRYPQEVKERGIQGRVIVQFVVEEDGTLTGEQVLEPVDPQLDAEAIRIARSMPKWKPGEIRGKPTRMRFSFPVTFRLEE